MCFLSGRIRIRIRTVIDTVQEHKLFYLLYFNFQAVNVKTWRWNMKSWGRWLKPGNWRCFPPYVFRPVCSFETFPITFGGKNKSPKNKWPSLDFFIIVYHCVYFHIWISTQTQTFTQTDCRGLAKVLCVIIIIYFIYYYLIIWLYLTVQLKTDRASLHWLPIGFRIDFQILLLVFKPTDLSHLHRYVPTSTQRHTGSPALVSACGSEGLHFCRHL